MSNTTDLLAKAVAECTRTSGRNLATMFALGEIIHALVTLKTQKKGATEEGVTRAMATRQVMEHCLKNATANGYSIPRCITYWNNASYAVTHWSKEQRELLVKHNTPWAEVGWLLAQPLNGKTLIKQLAAGTIDRIRSPMHRMYIGLRPPVSQRRIEQEHTPRSTLPESTIACTVKTKGQVNREVIIDFLAHIGSVIGLTTLDEIYAEARTIMLRRQQHSDGV